MKQWQKRKKKCDETTSQMTISQLQRPFRNRRSSVLQQGQKRKKKHDETTSQMTISQLQRPFRNRSSVLQQGQKRKKKHDETKGQHMYYEESNCSSGRRRKQRDSNILYILFTLWYGFHNSRRSGSRIIRLKGRLTIPDMNSLHNVMYYVNSAVTVLTDTQSRHTHT